MIRSPDDLRKALKRARVDLLAFKIEVVPAQAPIWVGMLQAIARKAVDLSEAERNLLEELSGMATSELRSAGAGEAADFLEAGWHGGPQIGVKP